MLNSIANTICRNPYAIIIIKGNSIYAIGRKVAFKIAPAGEDGIIKAGYGAFAEEGKKTASPFVSAIIYLDTLLIIPTEAGIGRSDVLPC